MAQMAGTAGKFLDRFDTNTEEKHEKCLPLAGPPPPGPKKSGCLGTAASEVLKRSLVNNNDDRKAKRVTKF
jgi:hypothetical protein